MNSAVMGSDNVLFRMGFRVFFMVAALFSVAGMAVWMLQVVFALQILPSVVSPSHWHAHAMIYGYGLAVIAGFLLTAIRNWTGIPTLQGVRLQGLVLLWVLARVVPLMPVQSGVMIGAICDTLFILLLCVAITVPIVKAKLWKNLAVVGIVYGFLPGHVVFVLDQLGLFQDGQRIGLYVGFYLILILILLISRRVMPMFIERGIGGEVSLRNRRWVDVSSFLLLLLFALSDLFLNTPLLTACVAAVLCALYALRLWGWYHKGIWTKPLLWVLYLAYVWIIIGFGLKSVAVITGIDPFLALHAFAVGGMGMMTLGMMSRISLGHTGRNIMQPPSGLALMFLVLLICACVRVIFPLLFTGFELLWVGLSQGLWISAFLLFLYHYAAILKNPRMDGKPG